MISQLPRLLLNCGFLVFVPVLSQKLHNLVLQGTDVTVAVLNITRLLLLLAIFRFVQCKPFTLRNTKTWILLIAKIVKNLIGVNSQSV